MISKKNHSIINSYMNESLNNKHLLIWVDGCLTADSDWEPNYCVLPFDYIFASFLGQVFIDVKTKK